MTTPNDAAGSSNNAAQGSAAPQGGAPGGNAQGGGTSAPAGGGADERYGTPEAGYDAKGSETFTDKLRGDMHAFGKDYNLSQKGVARMYEIANSHAKNAGEMLEASHKANVAEWTKQSASDKEFGGEAYDANRAVAAKGLETFGTPELREVLKGSGLEQHPEFMRFFYRVGKAVSEDKFVRGGSSNTGDANKTPGLFSYPNSQHS